MMQALRRHPWIAASLIVLLAFTVYVAILNWDVTRKFEGRRWDLPAHVYARPLELYVGLPLAVDRFEAEIRRLGYRYRNVRPHEPGSFRRLGNRFELVTRPFPFWDGEQPAQFLAVEFEAQTVSRLANDRGNAAIARLEPLMIGSLFADHGEDRLVVSPLEVPALLPAALIAVEDRRFYQHSGVDLLALMRALAANVRAGAITQGGSTLTQQLVKNYFLDNRQTLWRKVREAITAIVLELHYEKDDLLNAYINEVYMGQDGKRAVHGFGLASRYYFSRPLAELELHQIALLVAMVRGPGYYDPYRYPERAVLRRNLVLRLMAEVAAISTETADEAIGRTLDLWDRQAQGASYYPGYVQLVRRQLANQYRDDDLNREGLSVFTALDPVLQALAERRLADGLERLDPAVERGVGADAVPLTGAVVITSAASGEVLAMAGDRRGGYEGFNRALDARRPIGSLVKPAVYLAALETGDYTLASTVADEAIAVELENGDVWWPANFDKETHGEVTLLRALAESFNLATVQLGLDIGLERVADTLRKLGVNGLIRPYPSLLLGAIEMTPIEVADVYGTLANSGFHTPYRAVRSVVDSDGEALSRYPIEVTQAFGDAAVYQLNEGLVEVMRRGTGRSAAGQLRPDIVVAGKSGTSGEFRDSWFAGFTGQHVMVVWIGHDDNRPTGFTGSSGALPIWTSILSDLDTTSWSPPLPAVLQTRWIQYETGLEVSGNCQDAVPLALPPEASLPRGPRCGIDFRGLTERTMDWLKDVID